MLPNFFVIGANKAATTSLHEYLGAHPEIFMSAEKEPHWFIREGGRAADAPFWNVVERFPDRESYEALFAAVDGEKVVGESSTGYLTNPTAVRGIREEVPRARMVAILRDPSARAHSAHAFARSRGVEPIASFEAAIDAELAGGTWRNYVALGRYSKGLRLYFEQFDADQLKVFLYEDFCTDPLGVLREIFGWLGVDPEFVPPIDVRHNVSTVPRNAAVDRALRSGSQVKSMAKAVLPRSTLGRVKRRVRGWNQTRPAPLLPETRARLVRLLDEDIRATEALIGRDLSSWRTP